MPNTRMNIASVCLTPMKLATLPLMLLLALIVATAKSEQSTPQGAAEQPQAGVTQKLRYVALKDVLFKHDGGWISAWEISKIANDYVRKQFPDFQIDGSEQSIWIDHEQPGQIASVNFSGDVAQQVIVVHVGPDLTVLSHEQGMSVDSTSVAPEVYKGAFDFWSEKERHMSRELATAVAEQDVAAAQQAETKLHMIRQIIHWHRELERLTVDPHSGFDHGTGRRQGGDVDH